MTITKTLGEGSANIPALGFATLRVQGADVVRTRARFVLPRNVQALSSGRSRESLNERM